MIVVGGKGQHYLRLWALVASAIANVFLELTCIPADFV